MSSAITLLLTLIAQIAPSLGAPSAVQTIINTLVDLIPVIVKEIQDAGPLVQNIIDALRNNGTITDDQLTQLDLLEQKADAEFEAAASQPDSDGMPQ